jgi:hypothetical protein
MSEILTLVPQELRFQGNPLLFLIVESKERKKEKPQHRHLQRHFSFSSKTINTVGDKASSQKLSIRNNSKSEFAAFKVCEPKEKA